MFPSREYLDCGKPVEPDWRASVHIAAMPLMAVALKADRRLRSATTASSRRSARAKERREKAKTNEKQ